MHSMQLQSPDMCTEINENNLGLTIGHTFISITCSSRDIGVISVHTLRSHVNLSDQICSDMTSYSRVIAHMECSTKSFPLACLSMYIVHYDQRASHTISLRCVGTHWRAMRLCVFLELHRSVATVLAIGSNRKFSSQELEENFFALISLPHYRKDLHFRSCPEGVTAMACWWPRQQ